MSKKTTASQKPELPTAEALDHTSGYADDVAGQLVGPIALLTHLFDAQPDKPIVDGGHTLALALHALERLRDDALRTAGRASEVTR